MLMLRISSGIFFANAVPIRAWITREVRCACCACCACCGSLSRPDRPCRYHCGRAVVMPQRCACASAQCPTELLSRKGQQTTAAEEQSHRQCAAMPQVAAAEERAALRGEALAFLVLDISATNFIDADTVQMLKVMLPCYCCCHRCWWWR